MMREVVTPHAGDMVERAFAMALDYVLDGFAARISRAAVPPGKRRARQPYIRAARSRAAAANMRARTKAAKAKKRASTEVSQTEERENM
jgi:hypothetical protein